MQEPPSEQIATAGAEVATAASSAHRYASRRHTRLMAEYRDRVAAINSTQEPPSEQIVSTVGLPKEVCKRLARADATAGAEVATAASSARNKSAEEEVTNSIRASCAAYSSEMPIVEGSEEENAAAQTLLGKHFVGPFYNKVHRSVRAEAAYIEANKYAMRRLIEQTSSGSLNFAEAIGHDLMTVMERWNDLGIPVVAASGAKKGGPSRSSANTS